MDDRIPGVDNFWIPSQRSILTHEDLQEGRFQAVMKREVRLGLNIPIFHFLIFIFQGPSLDTFPLVKFHTEMATSWDNFVDKKSVLEMEMSHNCNCQ